MSAIGRTAPLVLSLASLLIPSSGLCAQAPAAGVSLKVSREVAPAGAIGQMKVFITEPKPITSGRGQLSFDGFSDIEGIALASGDAAGVALVHGGSITLAISSPSGMLGMAPDYPLLTIAGRVPASAPLGVRIPMRIDPSALQLLDPAGAAYPTEVKAGFLESGGTLSIGDVVPGSATVPAGGIVSIFGTGFRPDTRIRLSETRLAAVRYISPGRIDVVLAEPAYMHGKRIRARNGDGSDVTYFSYQRTRAWGASTHPVLETAIPIFAERRADAYAIDVSPQTAGIAVQNQGDTDALVIVELRDANGVFLAAGVLLVPADSYVLRSAVEVFGVAPGAAGTLTLSANVPVQALAIDLGPDGRATPRLPR